MGASTLPWLSGMNKSQQDAVLHSGRGLLILAGAGSGKTRVITAKIAYLVREKRIPPHSILAVTFTNKAAREMKARAEAFDPACGQVMIRTFHSFGAWYLRANSKALGLNSNFSIYDDDDSTTLIHGLLPDETRSTCGRWAQYIARAKDFNLSPDDPLLFKISEEEKFRRIFTMYEEKLRSMGNVDFGDLIRLPTRLLRDDSAISLRTRQRFRVILVDEYQDSNIAQFEMLKELDLPTPDAGPAYLCVVGDDDQSIYRFRGAELRNILEFQAAFPGSDMIKLERNYRSYQSILNVADDIVSHNSGRLGKSLEAERKGGSAPVLAILDDQDHEAKFCIELARRHRERGGRLADIAILYRTNAQSLNFEKAFAHAGLAYRIVGSTRFYDREEIKDALSYLALLANPADEIAFKRIVNKPARGIGKTSQDAILGYGAKNGLSCVAAAQSYPDSLSTKARGGLASFLTLLRDARTMLINGSPSGYFSGRATDDSPDRHESEGPVADASNANSSMDFVPGLAPEKSKDSGYGSASHQESNVPAAADIAQGGAASGAFVEASAIDGSAPRRAAASAMLHAESFATQGGNAQANAESSSARRASGSASMLSEVVAHIIDRSGLSEFHQEEDEVAGTQRVANLSELISAAAMYTLNEQGLSEFLESIALDRSLVSGEEDQADRDAITLITMHNTKGLEFPVVIVTGLEQGLFPRDDEEGANLEEQRRLFYVAVTRAKNELYLTSCASRIMRGRFFEMMPSRFLLELDPAHFELAKSRGSHPRLASLSRKFHGAKSGGFAGAQGSNSAGAYEPKSILHARAFDNPEKRWKRGVAVYHEDFGYGFVSRVEETTNSGPIVDVEFETGAIKKFYPRYAAKLETRSRDT